MRGWLSVAALVSAGCLADPAPPAWTETEFPPTSVVMHIIGGAVVDVDGDGVDDVVLRNDPCAETAGVGAACSHADQGFFVLRGQSGRGLGGAYTFTPTPDTRPFALHFRDIDGDGIKDALVFGADQTATDGVLAAHLALAPASFAEPHLLALTEAPPPELVEDRPNLIGDADIDGDDTPDFVLSRWGSVFTIEIEATGSAFGSNAFTKIGPDGTMVVAVTTVPNTGASGDDLLLDGRGEALWLDNDGSGGFGAGITNSWSADDIDAVDNFAFFHDMNGDGLVDVVGAGDDIIRVTTTGQTAESVLFDNSRNRAYGSPLAFVKAPLNGDPRPDAVGVRRHGAACPCTYTIDAYVDFEIDESDGKLRENAIGTPSLELPDGQIPTAVGIGDFNDDGTVDVVIFGKDGERTCARATDREVVATPC